MSTDVLYILFGGFVLSLIHAAIPNHWIPISTFAKVNEWNKGFTNLVAVITAFFHSLSTIIVGTLIGIVGIVIWQKYETVSKLLAAGIFIIMGIIYVSMHVFNVGKHHHHHDEEFHLLHTHKISTIMLILLVIGMIIISLYYILESNEKIIGLTLIGISIISIFAAITIFLINSKKHFFSYNYHIHNDEYIHEHDSHHHHHHHEHLEINQHNNKVKKISPVVALSLALFFSPCTEIEIFYLQAAKIGIYGIVLLSLIYLLITIFVTVLLVNLSSTVIEKLKLNKLEHNEDLITGIILISLSVLFLVL